MIPSIDQQRGVALITVLLVVAIVTVVCASLISRQHLAIRTTSNQVLARQAWHYALGGEILAKAMLYEDLQHDHRQGAVDHLGEAWAKPLPPYPLEDGEIRLQIDDLSGRFNLNNLLQGQHSNAAAVAQLQRLLLRLGILAPYAERLSDWLDSDQTPNESNGAEDADYQRLDPPYRTAGRRLSDISELRLLLDMRDEDYQRLEPFVAALPVGTPLNLNTASALVLASLDDKLSVENLQALLATRPETGFRDVNAFLSQPALEGVSLKGSQLGVSSQHFQVTTHVRLGERQWVLVSQLVREDDGSLRVVQRTLGRPRRTQPEGE